MITAKNLFILTAARGLETLAAEIISKDRWACGKVWRKYSFAKTLIVPLIAYKNMYLKNR